MSRIGGNTAQAKRYIWQHPSWPSLRFNQTETAPKVVLARRQQGILLGQVKAIGLQQLQKVIHDVWIEDAVATAAIEGEKLDLNSVRSSVLRRLGLASGQRRAVDRRVDGLIEVMEDATTGYQTPLTADRLCRWQSALFPGGTSGIQRIEVGRFRTHSDPMQIVGGPLGKETVYYTAPPASRVPTEMRRFLKWFEDTRPDKRGPVDGIVRAAMAHLWFETVHPFEDGNGRIGRAIVDLALAQDSEGPIRFYSMSHQVMRERKAYYNALGNTQRGGVDVTGWVVWFLDQFIESCLHSTALIEAAIAKSKFWSLRADRPLN
ncbi:MAG: Fic family protein, partial [Burkholderiaceae bacterium]